MGPNVRRAVLGPALWDQVVIHTLGRQNDMLHSPRAGNMDPVQVQLERAIEWIQGEDPDQQYQVRTRSDVTATLQAAS